MAWGQGGGENLPGKVWASPNPVPTAICPALASHGRGRQEHPTPGPVEEGKPRGQNHDALGWRLCPAEPQLPWQRAQRPQLGADAQGISQAFGAGPAAPQMQRPQTVGETPGTHLGPSEPRPPLPEHGEDGRQVGKPACPRGSLAAMPGSSQQPALQAQPGVGDRCWRQRWVQVTESPAFTSTRPGSHGPTESLSCTLHGSH